MPLLDDMTRMLLPPLHGQEAADTPIVYARFFLPGTRWVWYAMEGEPEEEDFVFFGFVTGFADEFGQFCLSEMESIKNAADQGVQRDENFVPGKLTDVVPAPDS